MWMIISWQDEISATIPRKCQTRRLSKMFKIAEIAKCSNMSIRKARVKINKKNIKQYKMEATAIKVIKRTCVTNEDFWGTKTKELYTNIWDIETHNAEYMLTNHVCIEPNGKSYRKEDFEQDFKCEYQWTKKLKTTTTTCIMTEGSVYIEHGQKLTSDIADLYHCAYHQRTCASHGYNIFWEVNPELDEKYVEQGTYNGTLIDGNLIIDELSMSFNLDKMKNEGETKYVDNTYLLEIISISDENPPLSQQQTPIKSADIASQLSVFREEVQLKLQYLSDKIQSPDGEIARLCRSMKQTNLLLRSFITYDPTSFAQIAMGDDMLYARATNRHLLVFPCEPINIEHLMFRETDECFDMIPITINNTDAFLSLGMIFHTDATIIDCQSAPMKIFELGDITFIQRKNEMPNQMLDNSLHTISPFHDFTMESLPKLSSNWTFSDEDFEYVDTKGAIANRLQNEIDKFTPVFDTFAEEIDNKKTYSIFGVHSFSIFGYSDAVFTWIFRFMTLYTFVKLVLFRKSKQDRVIATRFEDKYFSAETLI